MKAIDKMLSFQEKELTVYRESIRLIESDCSEPEVEEKPVYANNYTMEFFKSQNLVDDEPKVGFVVPKEKEREDTKDRQVDPFQKTNSNLKGFEEKQRVKITEHDILKREIQKYDSDVEGTCYLRQTSIWEISKMGTLQKIVHSDPSPYSQFIIICLLSYYYYPSSLLMRIIAQRVLDASVTVSDQIISQIGRGLLVLVGFTKGDNNDVIKDFANKTVNMRLWESEGKAWVSSVKDINGEILVVSQFTLYGYFKGNKPDFHDAMDAEEARKLYGVYVDVLRGLVGHEKVQTGQFQTRMVVRSANEGPVTMLHSR